MNCKSFNRFIKIFTISVCFLSLIYIENQWLTKCSEFFFKYLGQQISLKTQYSNWTFECQVSKETDPNHERFLLLEKSNRNHGAIFKSVLKRLHHGLGLSHLRSALSTAPFFRDIWGLRYLKNNSEILVNH